MAVSCLATSRSWDRKPKRELSGLLRFCRRRRRSGGCGGTVADMAEQQRHRYPRYSRFIMAGAAVGFAVSVVLVFAFATPTGDYSRQQIVFYLGAILAALGALLGGAIAVLLEARGRRRRTRARQPDDAR